MGSPLEFGRNSDCSNKVESNDLASDNSDAESISSIPAGLIQFVPQCLCLLSRRLRFSKRQVSPVAKLVYHPFGLSCRHVETSAESRRVPPGAFLKQMRLSVRNRSREISQSARGKYADGNAIDTSTLGSSLS